jgi:Mrp family chromosome partitioning ATPase
MSEERDNCSSASSCDRESCEGCPSKAKESFLEDMNPLSNIKHVIGVVSGKGGVGKSFVTSTLAAKLRKQGKKVGILDADITGPSIPKMFGVHGPAEAVEDGTYPIEAEDGTKIMSINLLLEDEEKPVVWRGPVIAGAVKQFWTDIIWGELDYLLVDMPPGTGDVPLTVFQSLPIDGIVIVTSPQELVRMIVKKAYYMAEMMDVPVLGVVENYSYIECPDCGKKMQVFGESHIDEVAKELDIDVLGKMPLDPAFASKADEGKIFDLDVNYIDKGVEAIAKL